MSKSVLANIVKKVTIAICVGQIAPNEETVVYYSQQDAPLFLAQTKDLREAEITSAAGVPDPTMKEGEFRYYTQEGGIYHCIPVARLAPGEVEIGRGLNNESL